MPTVGYRISAATPSRSWSASRACGSQPPRCSSSNRTPKTVKSSARLPAAATSPIGIGLSRPSMTKRSPRLGSLTTWGARSRNFASIRSTYVFGGSVMCESAEMIGLAMPSRAFERARVGHDHLRAVGLFAVHPDVGARLTVLHVPARDDAPRGEGLVRPQHVGELHIQASAQIEAAAEMSGQELGDARDRHASADDRVLEAELLRGVLVIVIVPAAEEERVAHLRGEGLAEFDRERLTGRLARLPRPFLAGRIAQGDLAAGLLGHEALMMDAAGDQVTGLVAHPHFLRDDVAVAPAVAIDDLRAAAQDLPDARRRVDLPFLPPPQVAEEVVEVPALELTVRLLEDDDRSHRSAERRRRRVPGVRRVEPLDVVLNHLVGDGQLECAKIFARVHVGRRHACDPPAPRDTANV